MKKEFVNYKQALDLKKLGFDEEYHAYYSAFGGSLFKAFSVEHSKMILAAPLIQQAFRFFRERYNLYTNIFKNGNDSYQYNINNGGASHMFHNFKTYEQAEKDCLNKLIGMVNKYTETKIK